MVINILYMIPVILGLYYLSNGIRSYGTSRFLPPLVLGPISLILFIWSLFGQFEKGYLGMVLFSISVLISAAFLFTSMAPTGEVTSSAMKGQKAE